jgi:hypothetical protein
MVQKYTSIVLFYKHVEAPLAISGWCSLQQLVGMLSHPRHLLPFLYCTLERKAPQEHAPAELDHVGNLPWVSMIQNLCTVTAETPLSS